MSKMEKELLQLRDAVDEVRKEMMYISKEIDVLADDYCDVSGHNKAHNIADRLRKLADYDTYLHKV